MIAGRSVQQMARIGKDLPVLVMNPTEKQAQILRSDWQGAVIPGSGCCQYGLSKL